MAGRLLGRATGGAVTLGFIYVGGAMSTVKRIVTQASKNAVQNWAMQSKYRKVRKRIFHGRESNTNSIFDVYGSIHANFA